MCAFRYDDGEANLAFLQCEMWLLSFSCIP